MINPTTMKPAAVTHMSESDSPNITTPAANAPTAPIPVQTTYAVPSGSVLMASARSATEPIIASTVIRDGISSVKPFEAFMATAQSVSRMPAAIK